MLTHPQVTARTFPPLIMAAAAETPADQLLAILEADGVICLRDAFRLEPAERVLMDP